MCIPAALIAQNGNGVTVSNLAVSVGSPTTVTFDVSWEKPMPVELWSDTVWVFVDYNDAGTMKRLPLSPGATLTATSAEGVGKVMPVDGNDQGVWVVGNVLDASAFTDTPFCATNTTGIQIIISNNIFFITLILITNYQLRITNVFCLITLSFIGTSAYYHINTLNTFR
jgi:hypothetical protein